MVQRALEKLARDESGHGEILVHDLVKVIGVILLTAGAAASEDVITIVGGIVLSVGIISATVRNHMTIDYPVYDRLNALEGKSDED